MRRGFGWVDLGAERRLRLLHALREKRRRERTQDDLGLGTIRDTFSEALFPGTSVLLTRARYFFFVPWIFQALARHGYRAGSLEDAVRDADRSLALALLAHEERSGGQTVPGIIGRRVYRNRTGQEQDDGRTVSEWLDRPVASIYWPSLRQWGVMLQEELSYADYLARFDEFAEFRGGAGGRHERRLDELVWHPDLPRPPRRGWRQDAASRGFRLREEEREFLFWRIEESAPGTLLAWCASQKRVRRGGWLERAWRPWQLSLPARLREDVRLAERLAHHVWGAQLLYHLLLWEERRKRFGRDAEAVDWDPQEDFDEWSEAMQELDDPLAVEPILAWLSARGRPARPAQAAFLREWAEHLAREGFDSVVRSGSLRELVRYREMQVKGARSRFRHEERLRSWNGEGQLRVYDFRWETVAGLLDDLYGVGWAYDGRPHG